MTVFNLQAWAKRPRFTFFAKKQPGRFAAYCARARASLSSGPRAGLWSRNRLRRSQVFENRKNDGYAVPPCCRCGSLFCNRGLRWPYRKRITINLAPADVWKEGPSFDLPIALGMLKLEENNRLPALDAFCIAGELALSGQ